jgi:hypothetical protein
LIEGTYTGIAGSLGGLHGVVGENGPVSKMGDAGWYIHYEGNPDSSSVVFFEGSYGNTYTFGRTGGTAAPDATVLTPEEMWNIDTKLDDGLSQSGKVRSRKNRTNCYDGTAYNLDHTVQDCIGIFISGF